MAGPEPGLPHCCAERVPDGNDFATKAYSHSRADAVIERRAAPDEARREEGAVWRAECGAAQRKARYKATIASVAGGDSWRFRHI
jgi:hypothetical protein